MMVATSREALAKAQLSIADIDCLVPHQANARIIAAVAQQARRARRRRWSRRLPSYGNSSAATIPFSLSLAAERGSAAHAARACSCARPAPVSPAAPSFTRSDCEPRSAASLKTRRSSAAVHCAKWLSVTETTEADRNLTATARN